ncbi:unnamed protein product [Spirodela intermedia]|uniref:THO complex subunit 2 n=1 Tax=Spirodela intermedia TaxID=51605 RepID=A0A7I8IN39_SPIIN|nr:unnamed protein product [Spirodela intermedia]CAA6659375.1 unnamed protein product [Spirodela intermedia]
MAVQLPEFKYVTEEALREWRSSSSGFKLKEAVPASRFLYELCWAMVRGDLPLQKFRAALDSATFPGECSKDDISSVLADIIAHMGQDHTMPGEYRTRLVKMSKWLVESALVPCRLFQERCEEEFLWESEFTKIKAQELKAKEVRVNTRLLYQQTKFNLLREESEGYAKLVTLLCHSGLIRTDNASSAAVSLIKSLIGHFDLDPNRVFDIVLECFELHPDCSIFYDLIPMFPKSHASQILGFKFQYYQRMDVNSPVPFGLYRLAALLVKADLIELDSIYAHLLPKESEALEHYDAFLAKRIEMVNKIGKINLAATGKDLADEEKLDFAVDFFAAIDMEAKAVSERGLELDSNQSLGLLMGFLSVDDWYHAKILFDALSHLNPVEHIKICDDLFRIIGSTISSAYSTVCQMRPENSDTSFASSSDAMESSNVSLHSSSFVDLPKELFQMLTVAGPFLYRDSLLLQKVCRVLKGYFLCSDEEKLVPALRLREARQKVEEALASCLLPSLQLIPANPAVGQEIWEVLCLLPYETRYRLYGEWEKEDEQFPMLLAARNTAKLEIRRILKRLAKENLKQHGRTVAKLAHANPVTVIRTIVHQIEAYKDMIAPVVDAFKYLTQVSFSSGRRDKLKEDGLNLSDWLQSLALFWGHLCKKYPSMELRGLFDYLVNQLKKGSGIELVVLQELMQQMANVQYTENMTEDQLDAMAGGETLRSQSSIFGMTKANKAKGFSIAQDEPNLAVPLLLLLAQHRSMVVVNADAPHIKMVSEQFDRCHGTLLQYVDFLSGAVTPGAYAQMIPSLSDLVHKYHLDPEVAFLIYRPVMRLFKCSRSTEICWPLSFPTDMENHTLETESEISGSDVLLDVASSRAPIRWLDILGTVRSILPLRAWNSLSPDLYTTFWGLTLYDLHVPTNRYESEITKQHSNLKALEELTDNSSSAITKRKKDKERTHELLDKLTLELQKHADHVASVRERLGHEKDRWLSSCPDTLKINMEFLQRCIFPRCTFSMLDAEYCAVFVHTLHSLGTPYFNTVNHIDVLICKTLQPMICCCTEYEAGRLGRFLYETLKMAYRWKSDESVYEQECGNKPGFAVYYRFPNSQRVTFNQFIRVHCKWNTRITRLLIQCLESTEYIEIRNALIMLTKISSAFPVTRKSGLNLEKRRGLKVLATGVAAALAARKTFWVSEEEFSMGQIDLKPAAQYSKVITGPLNVLRENSQSDSIVTKCGTMGAQFQDMPSTQKDPAVRAKPSDVMSEGLEGIGGSKPDLAQQKVGVASGNRSEFTYSSTMTPGNPSTIQATVEDSTRVPGEENITKQSTKASSDAEPRPHAKRSTQAVLAKQSKQELKDDSRPEKSGARNAGQVSSTAAGREVAVQASEGRQGGSATALTTTNGSATLASAKGSLATTRPIADTHGGITKPAESKASVANDNDIDGTEKPRHILSRRGHSPLHDDSFTARPSDKDQRRSATIDEQESESTEIRTADREKPSENFSNEEQPLSRLSDRGHEKLKDKASERHDKDHRDKVDRPDKLRGEDALEKNRERSMERYVSDRSTERMQERGTDRTLDRTVDKSRDDRGKDERSKARHTDAPLDKSHSDDRFQSLPPPPPYPLVLDEEADRRVTSARHTQRLSPKHDDKERRRSEENLPVLHEEAKRRREEDLRDRKRDERDSQQTKREREKGNISKDDAESNAATKRRKLKRDHLSSMEAGDVSQRFDGRESGERKVAMALNRANYAEEPVQRMHTKEAASKIPGGMPNNTCSLRFSLNQARCRAYDREWEDEKRQRAEVKRKHRK